MPNLYSIGNTFADLNASKRTSTLDLIREECLPKKQALIPTRNALQSYNCMWACSSAGRAPALQAGGRRFEPCHVHQFFQRLTACPHQLIRSTVVTFVVTL
jgi:hypothetical protein